MKNKNKKTKNRITLLLNLKPDMIGNKDIKQSYLMSQLAQTPVHNMG